MDKVKVVRKGDKDGHNMIIRFRLPSGLEIYGLPTRNFFESQWDLGPTWNYLVLADKPFLVDVGRYGQGRNLVNMIESVGIKGEEIKSIIISHGHEDHDGGLKEVIKDTKSVVRAHPIYKRLIKKYSEKAPQSRVKNFPAKCWNCFMPESFYKKYCVGYHEDLQELDVEVIDGGEDTVGTDIHTYHLPGHSPDCLAVLLGDEAILVGDIVLPDLTPWPTSENTFVELAEVLAPDYTDAQAIFGLRCYIESLKKLGEKARQQPELLVLPAHRIYFGGQWNGIILEERVQELLRHHVDRCGAILDILNGGSKTAVEIAEGHFEPSLLTGSGRIMGIREIISHCELLIHSGDVVSDGNGKFEATGSSHFEGEIL